MNHLILNGLLRLHATSLVLFSTANCLETTPVTVKQGQFLPLSVYLGNTDFVTNQGSPSV